MAVLRSAALLTLVACSGLKADQDPAGPSATSPTTTDEPTSTTPSTAREPFVAAPAALHRLTDPQYRNAAEALVGLRYDGELPIDYSLHGYTNVGAGELSIGPVDLELYEAAAWVLAEAALPDDAALEAFLGAPYHRDVLAAALPDLTLQALRRPATQAELDELLILADSLAPLYGGRVATQGVLATLLQAPEFLFRTEVGTPDPANPGTLRLTDWELASKLSFFLTDAPPDALLLAAAGAGDLTAGDLAAHAERLVATPQARAALSGWFDQTLELDRIDTLAKDATLFPELEALRPDMHAEITELFAATSLDSDGDLRDLLTTNVAYPSPALAAAVYGVTGAGNAITLPADQERGGVLGRAGILAVGAHNTVTSPTHRGKLVRTRLLCGSVPPPPAGVVTELSDATEGSLRDRLEQHATDPLCQGCHEMMDPIGYGLEHFDPIGRYREFDDGYVIDATGEMDGLSFDGGASLGEAIAAHPDFPGCMSAQLYRHAMGHVELETELGAIDAITEAFVDDGHRVSALVRAIVGSEAFLTVADPERMPCTNGEQLPCDTLCGPGTETCSNGTWGACTAPTPAVEDCNGIDDDCDGAVDDFLTQTCTTAWGTGFQTCVAGTWADCEGAGPPVEVCNGLDDDGDTFVDEGLEVAVVSTSPAELTATFAACDPATASWNGPCNAAVNRFCGANACAITGFGPTSIAGDEVVCLDSSEAVVINGSFAALGAIHSGCGEFDTHSGPCNAAISRDCSARGYGSGYGPVENSGDIAVYVCTPNGVTISASYLDLATYEPYCDGFAERVGSYCSAAIHEYCIDQGFETGHGPTENTGDLAVVYCMGAN
jgi:hypothetical protein